ncbi:MAG: hypothetical protein V4808_03165 [Pseudomonadota bacterium]
MLRLALILLATFAAVSAHAQAVGDVARRAIQRTLNGVQAPIYGAGKVLPGVTAAYTAGTNGCRSDILTVYPAHSHSGSSFAARTQQDVINWNRVTGVKLQDAYVIVFAPDLVAAGRYLYAGSAIAAAVLKAHMDNLTSICGGPGAATA